MENRTLAQILEIRGMLVAILLGLAFGIVNVLIALSTLSVWTSFIFSNACNISLLYDYTFGRMPYVHIFIIGLPLTILAGVTTAMLTSNFIKNKNDALIMGGMTGIISSILPYGSTWALLLLFADHWMYFDAYLQYFLLVLVGVIVYTPLAMGGAYYYAKGRLASRPGGVVNEHGEKAALPGLMEMFKTPVLLSLATVFTIVIPLIVVYACVQMGWISGTPWY